jgi:hypothetical protein
MKASCTLFAALSLASSAVLAQSSQPSEAEKAAPSVRIEQPRQQDQSQMQQGTAATQQGQQADQQQNLQQGQQSSGASANGSTQSSGDQQSSPQSSSDQQSSGTQSSGMSSSAGSQAGGEGQLITSEIAHSKVAEAKTPSMIEQKTENGVSYVCGGIGDDEAQQMKDAARNHDLNLIFAARDGSYVSNVNVTIADAKGNQVLQTNCGGPRMSLNLPKSGTYRIHADASGYTLNRTVRVNTKGHTQTVFAWPLNKVDESATSTGSSGNVGSTGGSSGQSGTSPQRQESDSNSQD